MSSRAEAGWYEKPKVERFGTLRELTQAGPLGGNDGIAVTCEVVVQVRS